MSTERILWALLPTAVAFAVSLFAFGVSFYRFKKVLNAPELRDLRGDTAGRAVDRLEGWHGFLSGLMVLIVLIGPLGSFGYMVRFFLSATADFELGMIYMSMAFLGSFIGYALYFGVSLITLEHTTKRYHQVLGALKRQGKGRAQWIPRSSFI